MTHYLALAAVIIPAAFIVLGLVSTMTDGFQDWGGFLVILLIAALIASFVWGLIASFVWGIGYLSDEPRRQYITPPTAEAPK
jgi:hypothetical protein